MKKQKILEEIKLGKIKMKPRWWFVVIQDGLIASLVAILLLTGILASVGLFLLELKQFPENLFALGATGIMIFVVWKIYREIGNNYKNSIRQTIGRLLLVIIVIITAITMLRIKYELEILMRLI